MADVDPIAQAIADEQRGLREATPDVQDAPAIDPIAAQIKAEQDQEDTMQANLLRFRAANDTMEPGRRAEILRYSVAASTTPELAAANFDAVKKYVDANDVDWAEVVQRQPALVKFMTERPEYMPLVKDDVANLKGIEWLVQAPYAALRDALGEQLVVYRQFQEAQGLGSEENRQMIRALEHQFANKDYGADSFLQRSFVGGVRMLPFLGGDIAARAIGGFIGGVAGGGAGAGAGAAAGAPAGGVGAAPGAAVGGVAGGITAAAAGQFAGAAVFNYYESVGPIYWQLSNLKGADGKPMDPAVARTFAQGAGITNGILFAGFFGKIGASLPGVKQLLERVGAATVEKALTQYSVQQAVKTSLKHYGETVMTGAVVMAAQSAVNAAATEAAKGVSPNFEAQWGNIATAAADGFVHGVEDMTLLMAIGPGRQMLKDIGISRRSAEGATRLEAMTNSAQASTLLETMPEGFRDFVKKLKEEGNEVQNAIVPVEQWTRYWQEKKIDPGQMAAAVMDDGGKAFTEAVRTKGELTIPIEQYLSKLAKTEHAAGLAPDTKLYQESRTPRQQAEFQKKVQEDLKKQAEVRKTELDEDGKAVEDHFRNMAVEAGIDPKEAEANAKIVGQIATTLALRTNTDVMQVAHFASLGRLRILGPKGEAVAERLRSRFAALAATPRASRILAERLKTMTDPGARAKEIYFDSNAGLPNARAFAKAPAPDGKPLVAHISIEGIKYLNDQVSHDHADGLYRAVAATLHSIDPGAAKVGGDFAIHVKDQAELEGVLNRLRTEAPEAARHFEFTGAVGKDLKEAGDAHRKLIDARTDSGDRAHPRRQDPSDPTGQKKLPAEKPKGLGAIDAKTLAFPEKGANANLHPDLVSEVAGMSDRKFFDDAYVEHVEVKDKDGKLIEKISTGVLTAEGWHAIPRKAWVGALDLKGLRTVNTKYGEAAGDTMLRLFGEIARHFGGSSFDFAHLHGDEYALQSNDHAALGRFIETLRERAQTHIEITGEDANGDPFIIEGVELRHGIGERSYEAADRDLNERKRAEQEGTAPVQTPRGPSGEAQGDSTRGIGDLAGGREPLGRGASPQSYPGLGEDRGGQLPQQALVGHIEGAPVETVLEQRAPGAAAPRGEIRFNLDPTGKPRSFDIRIFEGDRSTLAHETAHFLSWAMHDIAHSDLATDAIRNDYAALLKWAGYDSVEARLTEGQERASLGSKHVRTLEEDSRLKQLNAKEERISHGWEQYLAEGKAPSRELASVFARFKGWLLRIYKGVQGVKDQYREMYGQDLNLSDDVRRIFDRMLAADDALNEAREEAQTKPFDALLEKMEPAERDAYSKALEAARQSEDSDVNRRAAEILNQQVGEERAKLTAEAEAELDRQPVYWIMRYLQRGELANEQGVVKAGKDIPEILLDENGDPYKFNRAAFIEKYGADVAKQMPPGVFSARKKGGVTPETFAPLIGFESGDELVQALTSADPRDHAIAKKVQARLDESYGPAFQQMADAAMSAVHSDEAAYATLLELRAMAKQIDPTAARRVLVTDLDTIRDTAGRMIAETPVGDLDPARYARAERQAALKRAELWGAGKKDEAYEHAEARLLNQVLYRAARDAQERLQRAHDRLAGTTDKIRGDLGKADISYRDVHDALLEAVGIRQAAPSPDRLGLDALLERAKADAQEMDFDVDAVRRLLAQPKPWESLTADEAQNVVDAATNIRTAARAKLELVVAGKRQTKEAWFQELEASVRQRKGQEPVPFSRTAEGVGEKVGRLYRGADALLTEVADTYAHMLDNGDRNGPAHRLLIDARLEAREKEVDLTKRVLNVITEKWEKVPKEIRKLRDQRMDLGELLPVPPATEGRIAPVYTRDTLWMLFLNWGNEGNRQRVRDGNGWTDANVQKALDMLTPEEADFLQGVLDATNSLYPELSAAYRNRTGLELDKVAAAPITVGGRQLPGGYFPLKYDSRMSRVGEIQEADVVASIFQPNYVRPAVRSGHTQKRVQKVNQPVDLSWGVVPSHLSQVIHDVSYGDWVRQAGGILLDPRFRNLTTEFLGPERAKEFVPWLRDVANAKADSAAGTTSDFLKDLGAFARNRIAVAALGVNMPVLIQNLLDPWNAVQQDVKPRFLANAYLKVQNPWAKIPEFALSKELAYRDATMHSNLRKTLEGIGPTGTGVGRHISDFVFRLYELTDKFSTKVVFKAAFDQAMSEGLSEAEAVKRADDVTRKASPSHDIAEKSPILRSKRGLAALVMFYGWANKLYQPLRRRWDTAYQVLTSDTATTREKVDVVADFAAKLMMAGAIGTVGSYFAGRGPRDDEDPKEWALTRMLLEPLNVFPLIGPAIESAIRGQKANIRSAPEVALVEDSINRIGDAIAAGKHEKAMEMATALISLAGGLPLAQIQKTGGYVQQLVSGEAHPRGPLDVVGGLIYGKRKKQPANPLTDLQGVLE